MAWRPVERLQTGPATPLAAHIASLTVGGTDRVDLNIAALNSHDGTSAFRILVTPVPVVCANTQSAALSNHESSFSIRHTRNANSAVQTAREALGLTFTYVDAFQVEAERLIQQSMTDAAFDALIDATFGKTQAEATKRVRESERRRRSRLHWLFADADTQASIRDTAWAGYQAVAEYVDHYAPVRAKGDEATARATRVLTSDDPDRMKTWDLEGADDNLPDPVEPDSDQRATQQPVRVG
jgi:phage/plasmid-like protein (TIGR03299 family)